MFVQAPSGAGGRARDGARGRPDLAVLAARARPVSSAASRLLPLPAPLAPLFADRALRRGSTTMVTGPPGAGATTLALTLLVGASRSGSWCGLVGLADPGVVAMAELGLDLLRLALVPAPGGSWAEAAATLLDGVDVVLVRPPGRVGLTAGRLLGARAKERRAALVVLGTRPGDWPEAPDLSLTVTASSWVGIGTGHGHLRGRRADVAVTGRRSAGREARHTVWLPTAAGAAAPFAAGPTGDPA